MSTGHDHNEARSATTTDRRDEPRLDPLCEIAPLVELPRGKVRAEVLDISPSGNVCLGFDRNPGLQVGKRVSLWYGPSRETAIVRHVEKQSGKYRVGLKLGR